MANMLSQTKVTSRWLSRYNVELLRELVITDFKLRYQGSVLGYLWSLFRPLALFTILYIVFAKFFRFGDAIPFFPAYLLLGIVLWTFFVEATNSGMHAIVDRRDLIRKVSIPKYTIIISTSFSALVNLVINLIVVGAFLVLTGASPQFKLFALMPLLLLELFILAIAASFLLSTLYVKYRDIGYIWELALQVLFYATPIIYPLQLVPDNFIPLVFVNPLTQIIQDARSILVTPESVVAGDVLGGGLVLVPFVLVASLSVVAMVIFRQQAKYFAENV